MKKRNLFVCGAFIATLSMVGACQPKKMVKETPSAQEQEEEGDEPCCEEEEEEASRPYEPPTPASSKNEATPQGSLEAIPEVSSPQVEAPAPAVQEPTSSPAAVETASMPAPDKNVD